MPTLNESEIYKDTGCKFYPHCLNCPRSLSECPNENTRLEQRDRTRQSTEQARMLFNQGKTKEEIQVIMGKKRQQIDRYLSKTKDLITETPKIRRSRNDKRIQIIAYIVTGHGIRETSRDCNVSKNTVRAVIKKNNINYRPGITGYWGHKSNRLRINKPSPVGESKK